MPTATSTENSNTHANTNISDTNDTSTTQPPPQDSSFGFSYFAVRRGKHGLRSSVFLNWKDCENFVSDNNTAEYSSFDKFEEAVAYLLAGGDQPDSDVDENMDEEGISNKDIGSVPAKKRKHESLSSPQVGTGAGGRDTPNSTKTGDSSTTTEMNLISPFANHLAGRRGARVKAEANPNRKPTKAWEKMYERYVEYVKEKCMNEVDSTKENADLLRWTRQQQHEYRYLKEGRASSMFQVKIDKLRSIGFEFKFVSMDERVTALLNFKEKHGNYNVPVTHPTLGKWVDEQKKAARKFADEGDGTQFFDSKIKELLSLGFKVEDAEANPTNGDVSGGSGNGSGNADGVNYQTKQGGKIDGSESNVSSQVTNPIQINNFVSNVRPDDDKKWMKNFDDLVEFKKKHGTCEVPPSQHTPLSYWVTLQHKEYQKIQEGKPTRLTLQKVQQLTDLGFVFRQVAKSYTWQQRVDQLRKYKEKHGHVRVPKSDVQLGVFVNRQRYEYSKYKSNRSSTMNESRLKDLRDLDFVFVAGKKMDHVDFKNKKTWDQRFGELLQFRQTYGHVVVPQSFPGLGEWVHSQRLYYKKLKAGKKSPLTNHRLLKLADVGFVFDATKRRGNHMNNDNGTPRSNPNHMVPPPSSGAAATTTASMPQSTIPIGDPTMVPVVQMTNTTAAASMIQQGIPIPQPIPADHRVSMNTDTTTTDQVNDGDTHTSGSIEI